MTSYLPFFLFMFLSAPAWALKIENNLCMNGSKVVDVKECGIDKKKPTSVEFEIISGQCQKYHIYKSSSGLGEIIVRLPFEVIPVEKCGIDPKSLKVDYEFIGNKCWKIFIHTSKDKNKNPLITKQGEAPLAACGFDLAHPTRVEYVVDPGFLWDSCVKKMTFESITGKGTYIRTEKDGIPLAECYPKEPQKMSAD